MSDTEMLDSQIEEAKRDLKKLVGENATSYFFTPESLFVLLGKIYPTGAYKEHGSTYWFIVQVSNVSITWFKV